MSQSATPTPPDFRTVRIRLADLETLRAIAKGHHTNELRFAVAEIVTRLQEDNPGHHQSQRESP